MAALIDEQVLSAFAVVGEPRAVAGLLAQRSGGVFTRLVLHAPYDVAPDILSELATTLRSAARPSHTQTAGATT